MTTEAASTAVAKTGPKTALDLVQSMQPSFKACLPRHVDPDRFLRICITAMRRTPELQGCSAPSLLGSMMVCAQLGLEPNDPRQLAFLLPYGNECQLIIGYRGYIELAMRSRLVKTIQAEVVHERDVFTYEQGLDMKLRHVPYMGTEDPGPVKCAYAIATMDNGAQAIAVVTFRDLEKARMSSQTGRRDKGPWHDWYDEMAKKTAIRRLAKRMPQSPEFAQAVAADGGASRYDARTGDVDVTAMQDLPQSAMEAGRGPEPVTIDLSTAKEKPQAADGPATPEQLATLASTLDTEGFDGNDAAKVWALYRVKAPKFLNAKQAREIIEQTPTGELRHRIEQEGG